VTYHNSLDRSFTLRIATELHLKRLVVGGFERVFEIGRIFRNEGISARHNPEFTSIELYQAYADYTDMMDLTEDLIKACVRQTHVGLKLDYSDQSIDFDRPFRRINMTDAVKEVSGIDLSSYSDLDEAKAAVKEALIDFKIPSGDWDKIEASPSKGHLLNELFEAVVEENLWQPTFVMDYPIEVSPLAKKHRTADGLVERFELFIAGRELANSFSELTDPMDQRRRLTQQLEEKIKSPDSNPDSLEVLVSL